DTSAGLAVKCGSWTLASVKLALELSGPAPWNAKGKASFKFLFVEVNVDFNKTWGKKQTISGRKYIEVVPLFTENFHRNGNWKTISGDIVDGLVGMIRIDDPFQDEKDGDEYSVIRNLVVQPSDVISFSQDAVPLERDMLRYGEAHPGDALNIKLKNVNIGGKDVGYSETTSSFAPSLITPLTEKEKLKAPSYENMKAGFVLKTSFGMETGNAAALDPMRMELDYDDAAWEKWKEYVDALEKRASSASTRTSAAAVKPPAPTPPDAIQGRNSEWWRLNKKIGKAPASKASFRRMTNGFKRYTLEMDKKINGNMSEKINDLMETLSGK
ncbi:MAG: hypothetical protein LBJ21_10235, partial [Acidobacteriota bacterium]|nr:hypothetical protein [Acidobacteriota bacterium]